MFASHVVDILQASYKKEGSDGARLPPRSQGASKEAPIGKPQISPSAYSKDFAAFNFIRPFKGHIRPFKGLRRPLKGLIRLFKGLIRLLKGLIRLLKGLIRPLKGLLGLIRALIRALKRLQPSPGPPGPRLSQGPYKGL